MLRAAHARPLGVVVLYIWLLKTKEGRKHIYHDEVFLHSEEARDELWRHRCLGWAPVMLVKKIVPKSIGRAKLDDNIANAENVRRYTKWKELLLVFGFCPHT